MAEAAHGTAPSLQGKNVANPMAMILAGAALLSHSDEDAQSAGAAIREACLEAVATGSAPPTSAATRTTEFTDEVIRRVRRSSRSGRRSSLRRRAKQGGGVVGWRGASRWRLLGAGCESGGGVGERVPDRPDLEELFDDDGVELRAGAALDFGERLLVAERAAVWSGRDHRVERVRDREHAGLDGDGPPAQPAG